MKVLLIDDTRNMNVVNSSDVVARTFEEGIKALKEQTWDLLLLDHDLACFEENGKEKTGYDVLCWLEEFPEYKPKEIKPVSMNPVGRKRMQLIIDKLYEEESCR